ncbi:MAG TPA: hypothetical protein VIM38_10590 [Alphaproteobacteria bacterium]
MSLLDARDDLRAGLRGYLATTAVISISSSMLGTAKPLITR